MTNWYMTGIKVWKYYPSMKPTMGWSGCFQVRVFQKSIKNKNSSDLQSYVPWDILFVAMAWTWFRVTELGLEKPPYLYLLFIFLAASRRTYILYPCILPSLQRGLIHDIILLQSFLTVEASMADRCKYTNILGGCSSDIASSYFFLCKSSSVHVTSRVSGGEFKIK